MKKYPKLRQPENYIVSEEDFKEIDDFNSLLNHLADIPASEPLYKIGLNTVGIGTQKAMVSIESFETPGTYLPILCEINTGVDLQKNRGIHMSRCIESIFTLAQKNLKTLDDFALELATMVREKQASETGFAEVHGTYIHKRYTRKTKLESYDSVGLISKAMVSKESTHLKIGIKVQNATACPCTKTYIKYSVIPDLKTMGLTLPQIQQILDITTPATHMQLGSTVLMLDKENTDVTYKQIYDVLDNSLHLVYELLKRPDEHDFVKSVIGKPQFVEDTAREVAYNTYQAFHKKLSSKAELRVESTLQDSIHVHDGRTLIQKTFGEIKSELGQ